MASLELVIGRHHRALGAVLGAEQGIGAAAVARQRRRQRQPRQRVVGDAGRQLVGAVLLRAAQRDAGQETVELALVVARAGVQRHLAGQRPGGRQAGAGGHVIGRHAALERLELAPRRQREAERHARLPVDVQVAVGAAGIALGKQ
ncbi:conserved hypothetical protein, partial [Ricinus communis]